MAKTGLKFGGGNSPSSFKMNSPVISGTISHATAMKKHSPVAVKSPVKQDDEITSEQLFASGKKTAYNKKYMEDAQWNQYRDMIISEGEEITQKNIPLKILSALPIILLLGTRSCYFPLSLLPKTIN